MVTLDALIDRQLRRWEFERTHPARPGPTLAPPPAPGPRPVITVSRQHGSDGVAIAERLAARLHYTLLHRDVIDRMCESTGTARRLFEALEERSRSQLAQWVEAMIAGRFVEPGDYSRALLHTILSIAELGGVVVVGRGANFILGPDRGFHVRVVGPRAARIRALMRRKGLGEREAAREADQVDHDRAAFPRRMFRRDLDDPLGYDVTTPAVGLDPGPVAAWLAEAARAKFARLRELDARPSPAARNAPGAPAPRAHTGARPGAPAASPARTSRE